MLDLSNWCDPLSGGAQVIEIDLFAAEKQTQLAKQAQELMQEPNGLK